jgi:hypothetical protein
MAKAVGQFIKGLGMAFLSIAVAPILALSQIIDAFSSFIS